MQTSKIEPVLCTNKRDSLEEVDKLLERCKLQRLNHEEIENINGSNISTEIETDLKSSSKQKSRTRPFFRWVLSNI